MLFQKYKEDKDIYTENYSTNFIILVPVLREQKIIDQTFNFLSSLEYPFDKLKIIIITSERELLEKANHGEQNTIDIVKRMVPVVNQGASKDLFQHIHYPYQNGIKSDQLNYALRRLMEKDQNIFNYRTYIGLYDADSITNKKSLKLLSNDAVKNSFPVVYQQPTIYLKNYDHLGNGLNGLIMKSFALWQTRHSLGYEIPMFLKFKLRMRYCIGHGLFIRADFLKNIGFFPSPIEDTRFGHILSYLGEQIRILPSFENAEVTDIFLKLIKQVSVWFTGESFIIQDLKIARSIRRFGTVKPLLLIFHKTLKNFIWASEGLIFSFVIFIGFLLPKKMPVFIFLLGIFTYFYLASFYLIFVNKKLRDQTYNLISFHPNKLDFLYSFIFLPVNGFLLFLGPQLAILRFVKKIFTKSINLPKTER